MENLSDDGIISDDINGLKKKLQHQKLFFQKSFENFNFSEINQECERLMRLTDNYKIIE